MRGPAHPRARAGAPFLPVLLLCAGLVAGGCGGSSPKDAEPTAQSASECKDQWHEVAESVIGLDQDPEPSALASRWTSVIATIDYYENRDQTEDCQQTVENQIKAITSLRLFTEKLRPYDMSYQLRQAQPAIDLYLHDPLPAPARNENGALVRPPTKAAVVAAYRVLMRQAAAADADLDLGWAQMASVDLEDVTALRAALTDLDTLAQDSVAWQRSEAALQILVAAIRAQEGTAGQPAASPSP